MSKIFFNNETFSEHSSFSSNSDETVSEKYKQCTFTNVNFKEYPVRESKFNGCVFINCDLTEELIKTFTNCEIIGCREWTMSMELINAKKD